MIQKQNNKKFMLPNLTQDLYMKSRLKKSHLESQAIKQIQKRSMIYCWKNTFSFRFYALHYVDYPSNAFTMLIYFINWFFSIFFAFYDSTSKLLEPGIGLKNEIKIQTRKFIQRNEEFFAKFRIVSIKISVRHPEVLGSDIRKKGI